MLLALAALMAPVHAGDDRPADRGVKDRALQEQIHEAIDRGVAYLKSVQKPNGAWSHPGPADAAVSYNSGLTALALYALSASGVPKDDPAIRKGVAWVLSHRGAFAGDGPTATYSASLLVLALTRIDVDVYRRVIIEYADALAAGELGGGMWTYTYTGSITTARDRAAGRPALRRSPPDNSNTQFAVLALWAAHSLAGHDVPERTWRHVHRHFLKKQRDGGWLYRQSGRPTATMTAAGIVSLIYAHAALHPGKDGIAQARRLPEVRRALKTLGLHRVRGRATMRGSFLDFYWMYSLERVGTVARPGDRTWYERGARRLVENQHEGGSWPKQRKLIPKAVGFGILPPAKSTKWEPVYETSLALLFLSRATFPPVRGATTESGGEEQERSATTTKKEAWPDVTTAAGLSRAFGRYHEAKPAERQKIVPRLGAGGARVVPYVVRRLKDRRPAVRASAFELLGRLVAKRFLFDPRASAEERAMMLAPIESYAMTAKLSWNLKTSRFE